MNDNQFDKLLNISTTKEQIWNKSFKQNHPYHATSYEALDTLFENYNIYEDDDIVDFGCGMGRLLFYINHKFKCKCVGIEIDKNLYDNCLENKINYLKKHNSKNSIDFECISALDYNIDNKSNKFYFFNPFSITIFMKIIENITMSYYDNPRNIEIILYYPTEDYVYFLSNLGYLTLTHDIIFDKLYNKDESERFLIYKLF